MLCTVLKFCYKILQLLWFAGENVPTTELSADLQVICWSCLLTCV